jgi:E3 ubiquitin-protein ligase NEDD4
MQAFQPSNKQTKLEHTRAMADMSETRPDATEGTYNSGSIPKNGPQGEVYGNAGPARDSAIPQPPLPQHWEELTSSDGSPYYANHAARTTTRGRPGEDDTNMREGLPAAWQELVDTDGRTYYANHDSRTITFDRPAGLTGELPEGWEVLRTPQGVAYFVDHNTHTATWDDPRSA